jgi:hypothetical protein
MVAAETMLLQASIAQVTMVAVAEEKRPTPGKRRKEKLTQRIIQTAKKCLGLPIGNHDTRERPMMTSLTSFF